MARIRFGVLATALGGILLLCGLFTVFEPHCKGGNQVTCERFGFEIDGEFAKAQEQIRIWFVVSGAVIALFGIASVTWALTSVTWALTEDERDDGGFGAQRIYIGNLPYEAEESEIEKLFATYGEVLSVALPTDRETGDVRGFGFIEMTNEDAAKAIAALDGQDFGGRRLNVNVARPRGSGGGYDR